jgi:flagellar motor switch protein FliN
MTPLEEIAHLADVTVEIEALLDRRLMTVRDLLGLEEGSAVGLTRSAGENVDMYVGEVLVGSGEVIVIERMMGVRITDFGE